MKYIELEFQGQKYRVPAVKSGGKLWFHWHGETHVIDQLVGARMKSGSKSGAKTDVITAPMPGKITRVSAKVGDIIKKGEALVVMEAMKMEYTLEAARAGKVTEISAVVGAQVGLGDVLVRLGDQ